MKVELHLHTRRYSACSTATPFELMEAMNIRLSYGMTVVRPMIRQLAPSDTSVLVRGETGTGKELIAKAIHEHSLRSDGPLVRLNCAALAESVLESGAFDAVCLGEGVCDGNWKGDHPVCV